MLCKKKIYVITTSHNFPFIWNLKMAKYGLSVQLKHDVSPVPFPAVLPGPDSHLMLNKHRNGATAEKACVCGFGPSWMVIFWPLGFWSQADV